MTLPSPWSVGAAGLDALDYRRDPRDEEAIVADVLARAEAAANGV